MLSALIKSVLFAVIVVVPTAAFYAILALAKGVDMLPVNAPEDFSLVAWPTFGALPYLAVFAFITRLFAHIARTDYRRVWYVPQLDTIDDFVVVVAGFCGIVTIIGGPIVGVGAFVALATVFCFAHFSFWAAQTARHAVLWACSETSWYEVGVAIERRAEERAKARSERRLAKMATAPSDGPRVSIFSEPREATN